MIATAAIDALLPMREVCRQTGRSRSVIYRLMAEGHFPSACRLGTSVRWSEQEVQAWIAAQKAARETRMS